MELLKRRRIKLTILISALILLFILLAVVIVTALKIKSSVDDMILPSPPISIETPAVSATPTPPETATKADPDFYVLILGLDYRDNHNALLTDSIMVLHAVPQDETVKLLSIPRDLLVDNHNGHQVKINALFSEGITLTTRAASKDPSLLSGSTIAFGSKHLDKTVISGAMANTKNKINELLDITIDHTVLVNFNTVIDLVDAVDGIEIDVKRSMRYKATDLNLQPGIQLLNGEEALGYARFREDDRGTRYYASDFERGLQQQEVVKALTKKITSWNNVGKAVQLLDIVSQNVQTDMDYTTMYKLLTTYYGLFTSQSLVSIPFPEHYSQTGDVILPAASQQALQESFKLMDSQSNTDL